MRRLIRALAWTVLALAGFSVAWVLIYRVVPPPATPLMLIRAAGGAGLEKDWTPLERLSPHLVRAVVASEDTLFCAHSGFDWAAIEDALEDNEEGKRLKGGSTISQQTAKNAFLWPDRTWIRKGMEAYFTALVELSWPKRRIMEVYLNVIEWGDGVYGAEAAARTHFRKAAADLTRREAALLSVLLPNPRNWTPATPYVQRRAGVIERRMAVVDRDGLAGCALP
ncbi:monofunctional biosynthetic peptidoglycan transglycosylase [Azospirillum sp.]|uniref:monofunctional biosynthetic peptidoglycan transglycosylase n=1 Tax=Azospirillum sp. TaxID=34012 RepID=UPI002D741F1A|nr:monofunctional biosynthetic peptidoglycan transglycosylase [Azospirillum sp.]HYD69330.1 monofunctional biosynthetic peptidoglycan transglycosylase [Azospirillum sp.]